MSCSENRYLQIAMRLGGQRNVSPLYQGGSKICQAFLKFESTSVTQGRGQKETWSNVNLLSNAQYQHNISTIGGFPFTLILFSLKSEIAHFFSSITFTFLRKEKWETFEQKLAVADPIFFEKPEHPSSPLLPCVKRLKTSPECFSNFASKYIYTHHTLM